MSRIIGRCALSAIAVALPGLLAPTAFAAPGAQAEQARPAIAAPHAQAAQAQSAQAQAPQSQTLQPPAAQAAPVQPAAPQRTEIVAHDNWIVTCRGFPAEPKPRKICSATLQIAQSDTGQVVFTWTIGYDDANRLASLLQTPAGVLIAPGVELKLGSSTVRKVPFASCDSGHCTAMTVMDDAFVRDASKAETAEVTLHSINGKAVRFTVPLKGIDKAIASVRSI